MKLNAWLMMVSSLIATQVAFANNPETKIPGVGVGARTGAGLAVIHNPETARGRLLIGSPGEKYNAPDGSVLKSAGLVQAIEWNNNPHAPGYVEVFRVEGAEKDARLGANIEQLDDLTGDRLSEFAILERGKSQVHIHSFSGERLFTLAGGEDSGEVFGEAILSVPDVNDDGVSEIAIGAPDLNCKPSKECLGRVYIFSGSDGTKLNSFTFSKLGKGALFGKSLALAGDINGDGVEEIAIGAPGSQSSEGTVFLATVSGKLVSNLNSLSKKAGAEFGYDLVSADLNGDGAKELVISSPAEIIDGKERGAVRIVSVNTLEVPKVIQKLSPGGGSSRFGHSLATANINNDGQDELIVGAPKHSDESGRVFVYRGGNFELMTTYTGKKPGEQLGKTISSAYIDHVAREDLVLGAPKADFGDWEEAGSVHTVSVVNTQLNSWHVSPRHLGNGPDLDLLGIVSPYNEVRLKLSGATYGYAYLFVGSTLAQKPISISEDCSLYIGSLIDNVLPQFVLNGGKLDVPITVPNVPGGTVLMQLINISANGIECSNVLEVGTGASES